MFDVNSAVLDRLVMSNATLANFDQLSLEREISPERKPKVTKVDTRDGVRWPKAYAIKTRQAQLDELTHLTETERALLDGVLAGAIDITKLGRKTRLKFEQYIGSYVQWLTVTATDYQKILDRVRGFLNYPKTDLQAGQIDYDELPTAKPTLPAWVREAEKMSVEELVI